MPVLFALSSLAAILIIPVVVVVLFVLFMIALYNSLVTLRNRYKNAYSQIDVQLKRRYDLIPNLVETAKGYMKHERETLEAVINAAQFRRDRQPAGGHQPGRPDRHERPQPGGNPAHRCSRQALCALRGLSRSQGQPEPAARSRRS